MMTLHVLPVVLLTTGAGAVMIRLGLRKGQLRARVESRRCASCRHKIEGWHCPNCEQR